MTAAQIDLRLDVPVEQDQDIYNKLGSFWTGKFADTAVTAVIVNALQDRFNQAQIGLKEDIATQTSVAQAPLHHVETWRSLVLFEAEMTTEHPRAPYYQEATGFYGAGLAYGAAVPTVWAWATSTDLADPPCISSSMETPEFVAYRNQGFFFDKGILGLRVNPFADARFKPFETDRGTAVRLWIRMAKVDSRKIARQYAVPLGIPSLPSTESYRLLCEGAWESRIKGPLDSAVYKIISGASGVPLCKTDGEVVEAVTTAPNGDKVVVTDKTVYRFPASHAITAAVGDVMQEGQEFTSALKVRHPASMVSGQEDITVPPGFFNRGAQVKKPIRFPNARVPVTPGGIDAGGNREISFPIFGDGADIKRYRGAANAAKLYKAFDTRGPLAPTVPSAAQIKTTINPAIDLIAKHTKPHLVLLYGDPTKWPARPEQQVLLFTQTDKFLPAHGRLILQPKTSSESQSSQSYQSSSSSSPSNSRSTGSTKSTNSSNSSSSSRSSRSTVSTASTDSSSSTRSTQSQSTWGTASSSSRSSQSLSSQSPSSRSSVSQSSRSSNSLVSASSKSTDSSSSTWNRSTSSYSVSLLSTASSLSTQSLSTQSERSQSSVSRSLVSASSASPRSESSRSSRSDSSRTDSSQSPSSDSSPST